MTSSPFGIATLVRIYLFSSLVVKSFVAAAFAVTVFSILPPSDLFNIHFSNMHES